MKSIFVLRETASIIHETDIYNFIISKNVVIKLGDSEYGISRTNLIIERNEVHYLVRKIGNNLL